MSTTSEILNNVSTSGSALDVALQGQVSDPLEWYFSRKLASTNLSSGIVVAANLDGDLEVTETITITVDSATGAVANTTWIEIYEGRFKHQSEIIGVSVNDLTLAVPIGFPFTTAAAVLIVDIEQNKDFTGTGLGQQYYTIDPPEEFTSDLHGTQA